MSRFKNKLGRHVALDYANGGAIDVQTKRLETTDWDALRHDIMLAQLHDRMDWEAQHGPVRVLVKDGKPVPLALTVATNESKIKKAGSK